MLQMESPQQRQTVFLCCNWLHKSKGLAVESKDLGWSCQKTCKIFRLGRSLACFARFGRTQKAADNKLTTNKGGSQLVTMARCCSRERVSQSQRAGNQVKLLAKTRHYFTQLRASLPDLRVASGLPVGCCCSHSGRNRLSAMK